jgi:hypothetical protein
MARSGRLAKLTLWGFTAGGGNSGAWELSASTASQLLGITEQEKQTNPDCEVS